MAEIPEVPEITNLEDVKYSFVMRWTYGDKFTYNLFDPEWFYVSLVDSEGNSEFTELGEYDLIPFADFYPFNEPLSSGQALEIVERGGIIYQIGVYANFNSFPGFGDSSISGLTPDQEKEILSYISIKYGEEKKITV